MTELQEGACVHRADGRILSNFGLGEGPGSAARRLTVDAGIGEGVCEFFTIEPGFHALVTDMKHRRPMMTQVVGEGLVEFHYRMAGTLSLWGQWGRVSLRGPKLLLWHQPVGCDDVHEVLSAAGRDVSVGLYCSLEWLGRTFGDAELPDALAGLGDSGIRPFHRLAPVHAEAAPLLRAIRLTSAEAAGRSGLVELRARALLLLCLSLRSLHAAERTYLTQRELANLAAARTILERNVTRPPRLAQLARHVGLSRAKLSRGFKAHYAVTIEDFAHDARLQHARDLLQSTDLQIQQVAAKVGYGHHSTFTAAFARHFGIAPKAITGARRALGKPAS